MNPTKPRWFVLVLAIAALLAGCESIHSMRDSVRQRIVGVPPHVRVVQGNEKQVFAAARLAMARLGYEMVRGGPAQGKLEGLTSVGTGNDFHSSRQREITINLVSGEVGFIEVRLWLQEIVANDFGRASNPATEMPVRDNAAYDAFFEELQLQMQGVGGK